MAKSKIVYKRVYTGSRPAWFKSVYNILSFYSEFNLRYFVVKPVSFVFFSLWLLGYKIICQ